MTIFGELAAQCSDLPDNNLVMITHNTQPGPTLSTWCNQISFSDVRSSYIICDEFLL